MAGEPLAAGKKRAILVSPMNEKGGGKLMPLDSTHKPSGDAEVVKDEGGMRMDLQMTNCNGMSKNCKREWQGTSRTRTMRKAKRIQL